MEIFEKKINEYSKSMFAMLGLHHWSAQTKAMLFMFSVFGPVFLFVIGLVAFLFISVYNKAQEGLYNAKIKNLETYERNVLEQMENLQKKQS